MRDFMLAMSTDYWMVTQDVDGVTVRSFYRPRDAVGGQRALQVGADALRVYSRRFGPYPFAELDILETPTRAGGIEYPGLIVIASSLYARRTGEGDYFDFVVAHEMAHQWWYSLVGDDQVNHPWLDESLAGYSAILYYEDRYGKAIADQVLKQSFEEPYQQLLKERRDQKVDQPVSAFTPADYGSVVYRKGPLFFKALREAIGDAKFDAFLKAYFRQNRYSIATSERMLAAAESVADRATVRSLFDQWIESATIP
jgi:aminopeptidase N